MIDFRYHVVSLVSVFMALAVGIVLGAGPLKGTIDRALDDQVEQLNVRTEQARADQRAAETQVQQRDAFVEQVTPNLVGQTLGGRTVAVVTLPGADGDIVDAVVATLGTAGADIGARVEVQPAWTDPDESVLREELATRLSEYLATGEEGEGPPPPAEDTPAQLGALLARGLVASAAIDAEADDSDAQAALEGLVAGDLVSVDGDVARGTLAVVVAPPAPEESEDVDTEEIAATAGSWTALAQALDEQSAGTVVAGPAAAASSGGVLAAVREDETAVTQVSTVDSAGTSIGRVAVALALRQQLGGGVGQYGTTDQADAIVPAVDTATPPS